MRDHRAQAFERRREQRVLARRARQRDGVRNPAAAGGRRDVAFTPDATLEIGDPVAAEHQVRVGVDQAGRHQTSADVDHAAREPLGGIGQVGARSDPGDCPVRCGQRAVGDHAERRPVRFHRRERCVQP